MQPDRGLCVFCKGGRMLCGRERCPHLEKARLLFEVHSVAVYKDSIFGKTPPNIFVGSYGYPSVFWGPLVSASETVVDNPADMYGMELSDIIRHRGMLVRGKKQGDVHLKDRMVERAQEVALSYRSIDVEAHFSRKIKPMIVFSPITQPMGPSAPLLDFHVCENPKIPKRVDMIVDDGISAMEAIREMCRYGFDNYYITRVFSAGVLGKKENKRMVPTRWSITAIDDMLSKNYIAEIKSMPSINEFLVFSNEYLSNHFEILLMPGKWEFENFEAWAPNTVWTQGMTNAQITEEHEPYEGRTKYAESQGGGYYASRFAVSEALAKRIKRQAKAVVFREVYEGYMVPVGVWEVRENIRHALMKNGVKFQTLSEALGDIAGRLRLNINDYILKSRIIGQTRLTEWL